MVDKNTIDQIKKAWQMILGADKTGKGAVCPVCGSGSGKKGTGVTPVKNSDTLKCFACGASGDVISLICRKFGWNEQTDFLNAVEYCANLAGITVDVNALPEHKPDPAPNSDVKRNALPEHKPDPAVCAEFLNNFRIWNKQLEETDYWANRGLSLNTCNHFLVGYSPNWKHPGWSQNAGASPRLIIPTGPVGYLARDVRKPDELITDFDRDKVKVKVGKQGIFNIKQAMSAEYIFIVEGEIDAMSIYEVGFSNVIGLGSISYVNIFIDKLDRALESGKIKRYPRGAVIALDNEDKAPVIRAKKQLAALLAERGTNVLDGTALNGERKDPNDLLVVDRDQLQKNCQTLLEELKKMPDIEPKPRAAKKEKTRPEPKGLLLTGHLTTAKVLPNCPIDLTIPDGYELSTEGIATTDHDEMVAARNVIVPTALIVNHRTGGQQFEVAINNASGAWNFLIVDAVTLFDKNKLIELTNRGLRTYAGVGAAALSRFLFDIIGMNEQNLPIREEFDQPGWDSHLKEFRMPWNNQYYMPTVAEIYSTAGDIRAWTDKSAAVCKTAVGRMMIGTAFSAPLLRVLGQRTFGVYLYGSSKAGKSACQKFAISAFGNPNKMMGTFNSTFNGIEAICTRSNDLPLLIDESTEASRSFDFDKLQYVVSGEQSRVRMNKDMNQRPMKYWRLPLMMNGEGRMYDDASKEGAMNRTLEIALYPEEKLFNDEHEAREIHKFIEHNHGLAGYGFIKALLNLKDNAADKSKCTYTAVNEYYYDILNRTQKEYSKKYALEQMSIMALIATGYGMYMSIYRDVPEEELAAVAYRDVIVPNMHRLPTVEDISEVKRAWRYLIEYCQSRPTQFYGEHHFSRTDGKLKLNYSYPILGEWVFEEEIDVPWENGTPIDPKDPETRKQPEPEDKDYCGELREVLLLPTVLNDVLAAKGFSPSKMLRAFGACNWIERQKDDSNPRRKWAGSKGKAQRMIVIPGDKFQPDVE